MRNASGQQLPERGFFEKMTSLELWVRRGTGAVFVLVGIYFCLKYIFGLPI